MSDAAPEPRFLDLVPAWLRSLGDDARALAGYLASDADAGARTWAAAGLNYVFKSVDLVPDGLDDIGYCDDAFVLRVAARFAVDGGARGEPLERLAAEADDVREFLEADYEKLETYVRGLERASARGRTPQEIVGDEGTLSGFVHEVRGWADAYEVPAFTRDVRTLVKLRSFLGAKLG